MRDWRFALAAVAAIPFAFGAAQAADVEIGPAAIQVPNWSGVYVGVTGGYTFNNTGFYAPGTSLDGIGANGALAGALVGFNWQVSPRFVVGIEADASISEDDTLSPLTSENWSAGVRARAGALVSPSTLFYLSAGWSWAHADFSQMFAIPGQDAIFSGPQLGVGIESMLTRNILARFEYLLSFYGEETFAAGGGRTLAPTTGTARLGLAYTFGEDMFGAPVTAAAAAPSSSWTGLYAGLNAGYGFTGAAASPIALGADWGLEGVVGGGMVGFDWQLGPGLVLGAEIDGAVTAISGDLRGGGVNVSAKSDWTVAVRGRAGLLVDPATMIYGLAGWSWAGLDFSIAGSSGSENVDGVQVGVGIETRISDALSARAEYRHTFYENATFGTVVPASIKPTAGEARIGVSYKFLRDS